MRAVFPLAEFVTARTVATSQRQLRGGMYAALRDAFDAAKRQLDDLARAQRGEVKHHEEARV